ncbi:conserved Plasmodium protein, unknown function [Plasmodium reichenowi]|uniref:Uncharacterized protein n=1 Tax=Plasmodium reichenowi TaxID=5854 RepID=A0A060RSD2_PLARE|nr:conserved Plasmodium protein, unknown function [Plasmodium reichenowi]
MSLLKIVFVFTSLWFSYCYSYMNIKRYPNKVLNSSESKFYDHNFDKNYILNNLFKRNKLYYIYPKQNLLIKNTQIYNVPRAKTAISLFKDINMSNFFPGFKTIFNTKFLFDPLYSSHKDIIIKNIKTIQLLQQGNYVKSIFIFGASCFTIFIITKLLLMLRKFFQNQYKMISEQEIELMGKYENPHIEFKD